VFKKNKKCYKGGNEHNFEARYSYRPISVKELDQFSISASLRGLADFLQETRAEIYECDVCVWCGKVVKLENSNESK
jgi:hypothetical protein